MLLVPKLNAITQQKQCYCKRMNKEQEMEETAQE